MYTKGPKKGKKIPILEDGEFGKVKSARAVTNYNKCNKKLDEKVAASDAFFENLFNKETVSKRTGVTLDGEFFIDWAAVMKGINMEYFYQYSGSQTSPPCIEGVEWNVYSKVLKTRKKFISQLEKEFKGNEAFAFKRNGNNRRA